MIIDKAISFLVFWIFFNQGRLKIESESASIIPNILQENLK